MSKVRGLLGVSIGSILIVTLLGSPAQATPANDRIGNATPITVSSNTGSASFTTAQAGRISGEYLGSDASFQNTVWYLWDPTTDASATISNCSASAATRLFVYEVSATTSSEPTSAPTKGTSANCTNGNSISIVASASKFYYIQVVSKVTSTGTVSISTVALPSLTQLSKVTICHRTRATTNPYRMITVSVASIVDNNSAPNGHAHHNTDRRRVETDGPAGVFRPSFNYPSNAKHWGDIIPPFKTAGGGIYEGLNWSWANIITDTNTDGIFSRTEFASQVGSGGTAEGNAAVAFCTGATGNLTTKQLYDFEREAGVDKAEILAELQEGQADEDEATRIALGGNFETPTADAPGFARPVPPTANVNRQLTTTKSKTVKFTVNFNESVTELATSDFETAGDATGCTVGNVSAASGTSVEVTVTCSTKGTVGLKLKKNGAKGGTDIGPELDQLSTNTTIEDEDPTPSPSTTASSPGNSQGNSVATPTRGGPLYKGNRAPKQSLSGVVWADLNQNGVQDSGEPLLADVTCTCQLKFLTSAATASGFRSMAVGPRFATTTTTVKTNSQGQYLIRNAKSGEWTTTCTSPTGMTVTYDSTGASDGVSSATVTDGGTGFTWVGMVGSAAISAPVTDPSGKPAQGEVVLTWDGPDGKTGTKDDVNFVTDAVNGEINLSGLPAGNYRIRSINGTTVTATLKVGSGATFQNALFTKKSSSAKLADTGIDTSLGLLGLGIIGFAAAMLGSIGLTRQRKSKI